MAIGEANVFEIIVLAARADAFLRRRGAVVIAFFEAEEDVFELVHPGIGEKQRRIVLRDERGRVDFFVSFLDEIVQELTAYLGACEH
jgi:hypothetical protein